jgi:hypothetical protein
VKDFIFAVLGVCLWRCSGLIDLVDVGGVVDDGLFFFRLLIDGG